MIASWLCLQGCAVLAECLGIKALENLNDTDYITAPSVQALLAFENFPWVDTPCSWLRKFVDYLDRYQNKVVSVKLRYFSL